MNICVDVETTKLKGGAAVRLQRLVMARIGDEMDAYDYHQIDKAMSREMDEMFSDPKRHAFYSVFDADVEDDRRGPRGGKIRGRKTVCVHCGHSAGKHVQVDH